ncbi:MAG: DUF1599 domain-containing protein [Bacteroidetes bacterium]|nr:DUF1599 domain-containing protein [Bacteroidota bacterium]MBU1719690.1 DUF1599 domain-containing protein [Bacteroidota bacterium]
MEKTKQQFEAIIQNCNNLFSSKLKDYGASWRVMRPSSVTDQIFIKASRIRSIEEKGIQMIGDSIKAEFIGIVNYAAIALIQLEKGWSDAASESTEEISQLHHHHLIQAMELMLKKNHDYGEAWRSMRVSSFTDIILTRINRIKQIEDNDGITGVSEGVESNFSDIINYAIFALIKSDENEEL